MKRNNKWWIGVIPGMLLLLATIVFFFLIYVPQPSPLSMGAAFFLLFLLIGLSALMTLVILGLVLLKRTRPIGYGMAAPVLALEAGWVIKDLIESGGQSWTTPFFLVCGGVVLLVVALIAFTDRRRARNQVASLA